MVKCEPGVRSQESFIRSQCLYIGTLIRVNTLYIYIHFLSYISDIGGSCKDNIIVLMNLVISRPKSVQSLIPLSRFSKANHVQMESVHSYQTVTNLLGNSVFIVPMKIYSGRVNLEGFSLFSREYKRTNAQYNSQYLIYYTETLWQVCTSITSVWCNQYTTNNIHIITCSSTIRTTSANTAMSHYGFVIQNEGWFLLIEVQNRHGK